MIQSESYEDGLMDFAIIIGKGGGEGRERG